MSDFAFGRDEPRLLMLLCGLRWNGASPQLSCPQRMLEAETVATHSFQLQEAAKLTTYELRPQIITLSYLRFSRIQPA